LPDCDDCDVKSGQSLNAEEMDTVILEEIANEISEDKLSGSADGEQSYDIIQQ
jgi:hypothetical protein